MKSDKNIFIAFILNLVFSAVELIGGFITGSVAIMSDAIHDFGDAAGIGVSFLLERKSKQKPDNTYTYGYARYSVLGSVFITMILLLGSCLVIYNAVTRIFHPVPIHYDGMIWLSVFGVLINFVAAWVTKEGESLNQKAVNLHMLEDVLGWVIVLVGAIVMRFTNIFYIDSVMSIGVAVFILINAVKNLKEVLDLFLEKIPHGIKMDEIKEHVMHIDGVKDVHHIHIWSLDGRNNYATMHVVTDDNPHETKEKIREELKIHGIGHATLELESVDEHCHDEGCRVAMEHVGGHHHHHHHH